MLHHIQKAVLDELATAESLRYGQIKPSELDGNTFGYHIKQLISDGYIAKSAEGDYALTSKGRDYIVHRYEDPTRSAHTIFLIIVRNGDRYLMRRRKVQPMLGKVGFIHGEPEPGIAIASTARKRLYTKTGIDTPLSVIGSAIIAQFIEGELQSYSNAIILSGETADDITISRDETGENIWMTSFDDETVLPSCQDIIDTDWTTGPKEFTYNLTNSEKVSAEAKV